MKALITQENITQYIPQRAPIVMVDEVLSCEEKEIISSLEIREDNMFVLDGMLTESGLVENIAQTAAVKVGYECHLRQIPVPVGFIGGVSRVQVNDLPPVGSKIETTVTIKNDVMNVTIISGSSQIDGKELISCEMKILIQQD